MRSRRFQYEGKELEVRATQTEVGWQVRVLENGKLATGVIYSVSWDVAIDARTQQPPTDLVEELMKNAQASVERGTDKLI